MRIDITPHKDKNKTFDLSQLTTGEIYKRYSASGIHQGYIIPLQHGTGNRLYLAIYNDGQCPVIMSKSWFEVDAYFTSEPVTITLTA